MASTIVNGESLTRFGIKQVNHTWKIENFSMCDKKHKEFVESEAFPYLDNECQWRLWLYPYGEAELSKDVLSVYLYFIPKEKKEVKAKYEVTLKSSDSKIVKKIEINPFHFSRNSNNSGHRFVKRDELMPHLKDDVLIISCSIMMEADVMTVSYKGINLDKQALQNNLISNLDEMLKNGNLSDITLLTSDGTEFSAHKFMLTARSPVFTAMFQHDMRESRESTVKIEDVDADTLKHLLHFIYTSKVDEDNCDMEALLAAANKYHIEDLKSACEQVLVEKLKVENAVDYLILADTHGAKILKEQAIKFINANLKDVMETD